MISFITGLNTKDQFATAFLSQTSKQTQKNFPERIPHYLWIVRLPFQRQP